MDKRIVETLHTSGGITSGPEFRLDNNFEPISLIWTPEDRSLTVSDVNVDYSELPYQMGTQLVKKTFLTYNGTSKTSGKLLETVLLESAGANSATQVPGFANSNEWGYQPSAFTVNSSYATLTDPSNWLTYPYDVSQGITVVKQFLGASPGDNPQYTALYRAPQQTVVEFTNVESNTVFTDGWYTTYNIACKRFDLLTATLSDGDTIRANQGQIYWDDATELFYVNTTGTVLPVDTTGLTHIPSIDTVNWSLATFGNWVSLMQVHATNTVNVLTDNIYYSEHQHLVTVDINTAIEAELLNMCDCCTNSDFGLSEIALWTKLTSKLHGAFYNFNNGFFKDAQCIIESARPICVTCSIHKNEVLPMLGTLKQ